MAIRKLILPFAFLMTSGCITIQHDETSSVITIDSPAASPSGEPYLFTDYQGTVYFSWIEGTKDEATLRFSNLDGSDWSKPVSISSGANWFVNWADYPMIATNGVDCIAHFLQKSGEGTYAYNVMLTSSGDMGKTWNQPAVLHDDGKQAEHGFVSLLPYKDGFFAAWLDGRNTIMEGMDHHEGHGQMSLRAAVLDKDGNKINEWELDERTCDCCQTGAAITSQGPVVVYRDRSMEEVRDISIVRLVDGQWTTPVAIYNDNWKINGCPVNGPRIAAKGVDVVVAWFSMTDDKPTVSVIFSEDGGQTFGQPIRVDEGKPIGRVDVETTGDGEAVVSWMEGMVIKAKKVSRSGQAGPSVTIASSSDSRSSGFPQMTVVGDRLLFAWTDDKEKVIKMVSVKL